MSALCRARGISCLSSVLKPLLFTLLFLSVTVFTVCPDEKEVEEKLELVLSELDSPAYETWNLPPFVKKILRRVIEFFRFLASGGGVYTILFYLLLAALLLFIARKILLVFMPDRIMRSGREKAEETYGGEKERNVFLLRALEASGKGEFSHGVILLHLGSLQYLLEHKYLLRGRDYTNREILRVLNGKDLADPFEKIALQAEMIRFKGNEVGEEVFRSMENIYRESFHGAN